jgi:hypothetical protein
MKPYLYIESNNWMCFEAESLPVKPILWETIRTEKYTNAIAALKEKALPVGNPEIATKIDNGNEYVLTKDKELGMLWERKSPDERCLYEWPGKAEIQHQFMRRGVGWEDCSESQYLSFINNNYDGREVYHLTLPNMKKIDLHGTDSGKLYIKPEDLFAQEKVQEVIKKAAMKSETSKKIQDETPQERIEREAENYAASLNSSDGTARFDYKAGATAELQRYELERTEMYNKYNEVKEVIEKLIPVAERLLFVVEENRENYWMDEQNKKDKTEIERAKNLLNEKP